MQTLVNKTFNYLQDAYNLEELYTDPDYFEETIATIEENLDVEFTDFDKATLMQLIEGEL